MEATDSGQTVRQRAQLAVLALLIACVGLSPRFPVFDVPGRSFEVRAEDAVVLMAVITWPFLRTKKPAAILQPLTMLFTSYLVLTLGSTIAGATFSDLSLVRGLGYWGKQVEYFVIFLLGSRLPSGHTQRRFAIRFMFLVGLLNGGWVLYELLTGVNQQLFRMEGELNAGTLFESYGPVLTGESNPLATGSYFSILFLLVLSSVTNFRDSNKAWAFRLTMLVIFGGAMTLSQSRASLLGCAIGILVIAAVSGRPVRILGLGAGVVLAGLGILWFANTVLDRQLPVERLFVGSQIENSVGVRQQLVWEPLLAEVPSVLILGRGSGRLGTPEELATEAHDFYLRALIESGVAGVLTFVALLLVGMRLAKRAIRVSMHDQDRSIAIGALAALVAFAVAATIQDMFLPVIPNELLWLTLGLAASICVGGQQTA